MKITDIKINGLTTPIGYDFSHVTVSWRVEDTVSASAKESRVTVAEDRDFCKIIAETAGPLPCSVKTILRSPSLYFAALLRIFPKIRDSAFRFRKRLTFASGMTISGVMPRFAITP